MILSENWYPLFGIVLDRLASSARKRNTHKMQKNNDNREDDDAA